jgi:hypothetical protein
MHVPKPLWKEPAVLVREMPKGERRIAGEGSLFAMVKRIASLPDAEWHRYSISLPDRGSPPFAYSADEFGHLLDAQVGARI